MVQRSGAVVGIAAETLETVRQAAADAHPNEYMAFFDGQRARDVGVAQNGTVITGLLVIPGTSSNPYSATVKQNMVPTGGRAVGSVHSHPNGVLQPSDADLQTFGAGQVHVIVGHPYGRDDWRAFDREGDQTRLPVVDAELSDPEEFFHFDQSDIDAELHDE